MTADAAFRRSADRPSEFEDAYILDAVRATLTRLYRE